MGMFTQINHQAFLETENMGEIHMQILSLYSNILVLVLVVFYSCKFYFQRIKFIINFMNEFVCFSSNAF